MPIFRQFVETFGGFVPSLYRRMRTVVLGDAADGVTTSVNVMNLLAVVYMQAFDAGAEALYEYSEVSWPLDTASGWVLDQHWGPYHNLQRNGLTDVVFRVFLHAKRRLNKSWGSADQALDIMGLLTSPPVTGVAATLTFTPYYPKSWVINVTGITMAEAAPALAFMEKKPSPQGGGFSVAGDNGMAVVVDPIALNYSSVYGVIGVDYIVTGWYGSFYGPGGGAQAGHAHVAAI